MEGLPWWVVSSVPGPPPRQRKHERRYTPSTHPFILTRRIWEVDYDGQMIFGELVGLKLLTFVLLVRKNPALRDRPACYRPFRSGNFRWYKLLFKPEWYINIRLILENYDLINILLYIYRASQILRAATDGCRSRPWLACRPTSGSAYWLCSQTLSVISVQFPSRCSRSSTYICKAETLALLKFEREKFYPGPGIEPGPLALRVRRRHFS